MRLRALINRLKSFAATRTGQRLVKVLRLLFIASIVGILVYQISEIGWKNLLTSLPDQPLFYALLLISYLLLPVTEALIYSRLWHVRLRDCLPVLMRKRVLNVDIVGYSGEFYLFLWAKSHLAMDERRLRGIIKDNLIASAAASLASAAITIMFLLSIGFVSVTDFIRNPEPYYFVLGGVATLLLSLVLFRFRSAVFHLRSRTVALLGLAHLGRFLLSYVLTIVQWWIVIPTVSVRTWAVILVVFVVINRIPFIPSSDLVLAGVGTELSPLLNVPVAPFVGMLLVRSAIERILNLLTYSSTALFEDKELRRDVEQKPEGDLDDAPFAPATTDRLQEKL